MRLNYRYRDDWLIDTENESLSQFGQATERVDPSLRYQFARPVCGMRVSLALDGHNLTSEEDVRYPLASSAAVVHRDALAARQRFL